MDTSSTPSSLSPPPRFLEPGGAGGGPEGRGGGPPRVGRGAVCCVNANCCSTLNKWDLFQGVFTLDTSMKKISTPHAESGTIILTFYKLGKNMHSPFGNSLLFILFPQILFAIFLKKYTLLKPFSASNEKAFTLHLPSLYQSTCLSNTPEAHMKLFQEYRACF